MESDADMLVNDEERKERSQEMKGLCCFFIILFMTGAHLFLAFTFRNTKRFKITCQRHLCIPIARFPPHPMQSFPTSRTELSSDVQPTISENCKDDTHRQSWARTGCRPRCASSGCIVRSRR